MIRGLLAAMMLLFGVVNLTSETANFIGWLLVGIGGMLMVLQLSGPLKPREHSKNNGGSAHYSDSSHRGDSDFSGGDGGGGGD